MAPGDRRGQRPLPLGYVGSGGTQQLEAGDQAVAQPLDPDQPDAGGGELDGQGHAVDEPAHLAEGGLVAVDVQVGVRLPGDAQEQLRGGAVDDGVRRGARRRDVEGRHGDGLLGAPAQRHPAGDQQGHVQLVEQAGHGFRAVGAGVHVVEHDERTAVRRRVRLRLPDQGLHGGDHVRGGVPLGDLVVAHLASGALSPHRRRDRGHPGLAAAPEAGQRDQAGVGVLQAAHHPLDELLAPEGRRARHGQPGRLAGHRLVGEGRVPAAGVVAQDGGLDAPQRLTGLDAELVGQGGARVGVHLEGLLAAVVEVQGRHQLPPQPLADGVLAHGVAQLVDDLALPAQRQQRLEAVLHDADPQLAQAFDDRAGERYVVDAGQRRSAPEGQRPVERGQRGLPLLPLGLGGQPLELEGVHVGGVDDQAESLGSALEGRPGALGPDPVDQRVQRTGRRYQPAPQPRGHGLRRYGLAGGQGEQGHQRAVPLARGRTCGAVDLDLHRPQHLDTHGVQTNGARRRYPGLRRPRGHHETLTA